MGPQKFFAGEERGDAKTGREVVRWLRRNNLWYYFWHNDHSSSENLVIYRIENDGNRQDIIILPGKVE